MLLYEYTRFCARKNDTRVESLVIVLSTPYDYIDNLPRAIRENNRLRQIIAIRVNIEENILPRH